MRDYGKIPTALWSRPDIQALSPQAKLLAVYLLTNSHSNLIGAYRLPDAYIQEDLRLPLVIVRKALTELTTAGFACLCAVTAWIWVKPQLGLDPPDNGNVWKHARKRAAEVPDDCSWKSDFQRHFEALDHGNLPRRSTCVATPQEPLPKGSDTLSKPLRTPEPEPEPEPEPHPEPVAAASRQHANRNRQSQESIEPAEFQDFRSIYPARTGDQRWKAALGRARKRIAAGHTWAELINGARRYAEFVRAKGDEGTTYVKQAASFIGTDPHEKPFLLDWHVPESKAQRQQDANVATSTQWLGEQEAADAAL